MTVTTNRFSSETRVVNLQSRKQWEEHSLTEDEAVSILDQFILRICSGTNSRTLFRQTMFDDPLMRIALIMPIAPQLGEFGPPCVYPTNEALNKPWGFYRWMFTKDVADRTSMQYASSQELVSFFKENGLDYSRAALSIFWSFDLVASEHHCRLERELEDMRLKVNGFDAIRANIHELEIQVATTLEVTL